MKLLSASGETVGEWLDRLGRSFTTAIESLINRFLNMPAEKLITALTALAIGVLVLGGITALEIFVKDRREKRGSGKERSDD